MAGNFQPPFYAPRPTPVDLWSPQPKQSPIISFLTKQTLFGAGGEAKTKQWRYDVAEQLAWQWTPANDAIRIPPAGTPNRKLWRYDTAPDLSWLDAPSPVPITLFPAQAGITTLLRAPFYVPRPGSIFGEVWQGSPTDAQTLQNLSSGGRPGGGMTTFEPAEPAIWTWTAQNAAIVQPSASVLPFSRFWRYDPATETQWQWTSGWGSDALTALVVGGKPLTVEFALNYVHEYGWRWSPPALRAAPGVQPFSEQWRYDPAAETGWQGASINSKSLPLATPFAKGWRYDVATETQWAWSNGWTSDVLTSLVVGGKPNAKLWRWDQVDAPTWAWQPPNGTLNEPLTGVPFSRFWRWDVFPEPMWQGAPSDAQTLQDLTVGGKPFAKGWHYDIVPQPDWQWVPSNVSINVPVPGKNFTKFWRYDLGEQLNWQWTPPNGTGNEPEPPFFKGWRYDVVPEPVWQGAPSKLPTVGLLSKPLTVVWWPTPAQDTFWRAQAQPAQTLIDLSRKPFAKLWRWDRAEQYDWQWIPPNVTRIAPAKFPPIMPLWWRCNLVPEPIWQRWSTPGLSVQKPRFLVADPRFVSYLPGHGFFNRHRATASTLEVNMPQGPDFANMDVGETVTGAIDFAHWMAPGVTIAAVIGVEADSYLPVAGGPFISLFGGPAIGTAACVAGGSGKMNTAVLQQWQGLAPGASRVAVTVLTSDGQTLIGWAHQLVMEPN